MMDQIKLPHRVSRAQAKLDAIKDIMDKDMTCCFCGSWMYEEIQKIVDPEEYAKLHDESIEPQLRREPK